MYANMPAKPLDIQHSTTASNALTCLLDDVLPRAWRAELLELVVEQLPHGMDALVHGAHVVLPLAEQRRIVEHGGDDVRAVRRRVRVAASNDRGHLRAELGQHVAVGEHADQVSDAFIVETEVLREGLRDEQLVLGLVGEVADRPGVLVEIARGEALVGHVEERKQLARFANVRDAHPLFARRVAAGWVMLGERAIELARREMSRTLTAQA